MFRPPMRPWRAAGAAILLAIGALVAINCFDQDLREDARALFERGAAEFSRDSGWALMAGLDAPVGEEPRAFAERRRRAKAASGAALPLPAGMLDIRGADELLCQPEAIDCVGLFAQRPESAADMASDNALLLSRYDELLRSTGLTDVADVAEFYGGIAFFNIIMKTQRVRLSQAAAAAASGRIDASIAWIEADTAFYRRWLEQSGSILSKMLAARGFTRDVLLAGQVARSARALTPAQWDALARIAAPLTPQQRGFAEGVRTEASFFAKLNDQMLAAPRATVELIGAPRLSADIASRALKRNATLNFSHALFEPWTRLDAVETSALAPAIQAVQAGISRHVAPDWTWIYNPVGKGLAAEQAPDLSRYIYRLRDADALTALARCTIELRRAAVAADGAAAMVASSPACIDPYTAKPLQWDGRELSFKPGWEGDTKRLGGKAGRVSFAVYP